MTTIQNSALSEYRERVPPLIASRRRTPAELRASIRRALPGRNYQFGRIHSDWVGFDHGLLYRYPIVEVPSRLRPPNAALRRASVQETQLAGKLRFGRIQPDWVGFNHGLLDGYPVIGIASDLRPPSATLRRASVEETPPAEKLRFGRIQPDWAGFSRGPGDGYPEIGVASNLPPPNATLRPASVEEIPPAEKLRFGRIQPDWAGFSRGPDDGYPEIGVASDLQPPNATLRRASVEETPPAGNLRFGRIQPDCAGFGRRLLDGYPVIGFASDLQPPNATLRRASVEETQLAGNLRFGRIQSDWAGFARGLLDGYPVIEAPPCRLPMRSILDNDPSVFDIRRPMPEAVINPASQPVVASYCTTFLKPEMLHIYRQVKGLRRYKTFVVTRERLGEDAFPFSDVEFLPRLFFLPRYYLKWVRKMPPLCYRGEWQQLMRLFQRRPADLMHIYFGHTGVHLLPLIQSWPAPCVVSFHGMDIQPRPRMRGYDTSMRELLQTAPLVLARSQSLLAGLERLGCPKEKLRLNRTGIPLDQFPFRQRSLPEDGEWRFVQACRLIAKKGLATAVRAFALFLEKYPRAKFVIAGDGPMKSDLEALIAELGLAGSVELAGFLSQTELRALYAASHVFLHPSEMPPDQNQEGVPNSMLEAMATGLPVLATTHGGIPEAVTQGRTGLLVGERDVDALFHAMRRIAEESELFHRLGRAAALAVREEFEQGKQIEKLEGYYDEARALFKKGNQT